MKLARLGGIKTHEFVHEPTGTVAKILQSGKNKATVTSVYTPSGARGRGGADAVMKQVTAHLDQHGIHATLAAVPQEDETSMQRLQSLYRRHGFSGRNIMSRPPKRTEDAK